MAGRVRSACGLEELTMVVAEGNLNPSYNGEEVVLITLWDGRKIVANYYRGVEKPDAVSPYDFFEDDSVLAPLARRLVDEGIPFITVTGDDDLVCSLKWTIEG